jgi:Cu2+-exporting ATPase/Cu+-exporting ATPase
MQQHTINVHGMHCTSCASIIQRTLKKLPGVESCDVNVVTEQASIAFDPTQTSLQHMNLKLQPYGYILDTPPTAQHTTPHVATTPQTAATHDHPVSNLATLKKRTVVVAPMIMLSFAMMIWEMLHNFLPAWPAFSPVVADVIHHLLPIFATTTLVYVGPDYIRAIGRFLRYRVANMDTLVGIGTVVAYLYSFVVSALEHYLPSGFPPHTYYDAVIVVIGLVTLGKYLEQRAKQHTNQAIEQLLKLQASAAIVIRNGEEKSVPIEQVIVGDVVSIKPGQSIPLDGVVVEGNSTVNESMITGESPSGSAPAGPFA